MNTRRVIFGLILSVVFIYLIIWKPHLIDWVRGRIDLTTALFKSPRLDWGQLLNVLSGIKVWPLVVCFLLTPLHVFIRSHRWKLMVEPIGGLRLYDSFSLQMVGYLSNAVLPLKMGELVRAVLLANRLGVSTTASLGTVLLERVVDMVMLLFIILFVSIIFPFLRALADGAVFFALLAVTGLALILYLGLAHNPFSGRIGRLIGSGRPGKLIRHYGEKLAEGFAILRATHHFTVIALESVVIWVIYTLQEILVLLSFNFTSDYPQVAAGPVLAGLVILIINTIGLSLPSAPSSIGTFHAIAIFGLSLFDVPAEPAAGFALVIHALTFSFYLLGGFPFLWREGLRFGQLDKIAPRNNSLRAGTNMKEWG